MINGSLSHYLVIILRRRMLLTLRPFMPSPTDCKNLKVLKCSLSSSNNRGKEKILHFSIPMRALE
jgi:hypothetical protein